MKKMKNSRNIQVNFLDVFSVIYLKNRINLKINSIHSLNYFEYTVKSIL